MGRGRPWTPAEDRRIRAAVRRPGAAVERMERLWLRRRVYVRWRRCWDLPARYWPEYERIGAAVGRAWLRELAAEMDRTYAAVRARASRIGARRWE